MSYLSLNKQYISLSLIKPPCRPCRCLVVGPWPRVTKLQGQDLAPGRKNICCWCYKKKLSLSYLMVLKKSDNFLCSFDKGLGGRGVECSTRCYNRIKMVFKRIPQSGGISLRVATFCV